jgi:hypothetical protein
MSHRTLVQIKLAEDLLGPTFRLQPSSIEHRSGYGQLSNRKSGQALLSRPMQGYGSSRYSHSQRLDNLYF